MLVFMLIAVTVTLFAVRLQSSNEGYELASDAERTRMTEAKLPFKSNREASELCMPVPIQRELQAKIQAAP